MTTKDVTTKEFEFLTTELDNSRYSKIGVSTRFGFGFMVHSTGYVSSLLGPEIYDVRKKYDLSETQLVNIVTTTSSYYYPQEQVNIDSFGSFDILYDNTMYTYEKIVKDMSRDRQVILSDVFSHNEKDIVISEDLLLEELQSGSALALWPLIKKSNR